MYNIVSKQSIIQEIKKSSYFKSNLGLVSTIEHNGQRKYNDKDKFNYFYSDRYKTNIYMQGTIGDIVIYLDYYIQDEVLATYYDYEEYIYQFDTKIIKDKGIDFYIGHILKTLENDHETKIEKPEAVNSTDGIKKQGNSDLLKTSPGSITYEDLKAYLSKKANLKN